MDNATNFLRDVYDWAWSRRYKAAAGAFVLGMVDPKRPACFGRVAWGTWNAALTVGILSLQKDAAHGVADALDRL